jgi:hypothetical protein
MCAAVAVRILKFEVFLKFDFWILKFHNGTPVLYSRPPNLQAPEKFQASSSNRSSL